MTEVWKDIVGYEGRYQVSNIGNVRSMHYLGKNMTTKDNGVKKLKLITNSSGYHVVTLKGKQQFVHRLVAAAFIPNANEKPCVDHINTITTDNRVENLRWVTQKENLLNSISHKRRLKAVRDRCLGRMGVESGKHRSVFQYSLDGEFIKEWGCMSDACRSLGIDSGCMTRVCQGVQPQSKGFIWRYEKCRVEPVSLRAKKIIQYDKDGNFIREWNRIIDAAKHYNTSTGRICTCLSGKTKTCHGFIWRYAQQAIEYNKEFI